MPDDVAMAKGVMIPGSITEGVMIELGCMLGAMASADFAVLPQAARQTAVIAARTTEPSIFFMPPILLVAA